MTVPFVSSVAARLRPGAVYFEPKIAIKESMPRRPCRSVAPSWVKGVRSSRPGDSDSGWRQVIRTRLARVRPSWRAAWVVPGLLAAGVTGYLAWGAWVSAADQRWFSAPLAWWRAPLQPGSIAVPLVFLALWLVALIGYWWPRRLQPQAIGLTAAVAMVLIGGVLTSAALTPCRGRSASGVAGWVLDLYVGNPPSFPQGRCTTPALAFQVGAPVCLGAALTGALTAASVLWREPLNRLRARAVSDAIVLSGLDALTIPLLQHMAQTRRRSSIVVIEPDSSHPRLAEARATGAKVMVADPASPRILLPVLAGRRGCALSYLYALREDVRDNEAILESARSILRNYQPDPERQPHLVARIDDPRHADHWRGEQSGTSGRWFEDALSPLEATACTLVNEVFRTGARRLLLCGDSPPALAILLELARRAWERGELRQAADDGQAAYQAACRAVAGDGTRPAAGTWPVREDRQLLAPLPVRQVILLDERAGDLRREYQATSPPAAVAAAPDVQAEPASWRDHLLAMADAMPPATAAETVVIITDSRPGQSMHQAGRVARLHPGIPLFVLTPDGAGLNRPIFDRLRPFQLALLVDGAAPEDTWTRVARHWHECYRLSHPPVPGEPRTLTSRPWGELDEFLRQDNVLQLRSVLAEVAQRGRQWMPARAVLPGSFIELTEQDLTAVARAEHTRWYLRRRAAGWVPASRNGTVPGTGAPDGPERVNRRVVPWDDLPDGDRRNSIGYLRSQLTQLEGAGFMPVVPAGGPPRARPFYRIGTVRARRLQARRPWTRLTGDRLHGEAGDWRVVDDAGDERTVRDAEFNRSHEPLGGGRYRRTGAFRAWQADEAQVLRTMEGRAVAYPGDWIVEGPGGERWPVTGAQFQRSYRAGCGAGGSAAAGNAGDH